MFKFASTGTRLPPHRTPATEIQTQHQPPAIETKMSRPNTTINGQSLASPLPEVVGPAASMFSSSENSPYSFSHHAFLPQPMHNERVGGDFGPTASSFTDISATIQQRRDASSFLHLNRPFHPVNHLNQFSSFDDLPQLASPQLNLPPTLMPRVPPSPPMTAVKVDYRGFRETRAPQDVLASSLPLANPTSATSDENSMVEEWTADRFAHFLENYEYQPRLSPIMNPAPPSLMNMVHDRIPTPTYPNSTSGFTHTNHNDLRQWQGATQANGFDHSNQSQFEYFGAPEISLSSQDASSTQSHNSFTQSSHAGSRHPMPQKDFALPPPATETLLNNTASSSMNTPQAPQGNMAPLTEDEKNRNLIEWKNQGVSYKEIKVRGGFTEAESTLRGRYRTLTKPKHERVRKPGWRPEDVEILLRAVETYSQGDLDDDDDNVSTDIQKMAAKVPWKQVAEQMEMLGCYKFGNATVKKKYLEVMADQSKSRTER